MKSIVIAGYARSPFTLANRGALMRVRPDETLNIDGGAIALGHLQRVGGRYALATQCIGGGQGIATILERI
jgi:acetyl-CoA acetyltransferase